MKKTIILAAIIVFAASCKKNILDYSNPNGYDASNYFNSPATIAQAATATYASFYFTGFGQYWYETLDAAGNEFQDGPGAANEADVLQVWSYTSRSDNDTYGYIWRALYRVVLRANLTIDKGNALIAKSGVADPVVVRSIGEAKFLRAFAYFHLTFWWGRVPLRISYDQSNNINAPRQPAEKIWAQVQKDLEDAIQVLPDSYTGSDIGRATKGAAIALLGKKYLYNKDYANAEAQFKLLGGKYALLPAPQWDDNFGEVNKNNQESIFEIQHEWFDNTKSYQWGYFGDLSEVVPGKVSAQNPRAQLYGFNDWANWKFSQQRANDFVYPDENNNTYVDPRAALTFYGNTDEGKTTWCSQCSIGAQPFDFIGEKGFWWRKYNNYEFKVNESTMHSSNNYRLIRYADVLLMLAECRLFQNDVAGAVNYINQVRSRAGAFVYARSYTQDNAFVLLQRERVLELVGEEHRYNDLKRWNLAKTVLNNELMLRGLTPSFEDKHYYFPIPVEEINNNKAIQGDVKDNWN